MKKITIFIISLFYLSAGFCQDLLLEKYKTLEGFPENIVQINFSPKSTYMTLTLTNNTIEVYDQQFNKIWTYQGSPRTAAGVSAFTPDEKYMAFGKYQNYGDVAVLRLSDKQIVQRFKGHSDYINSLLISPDGQYMISGGADQVINLWKWNKDKFEELFKFDLSQTGLEKVNELAFSPDGSTLAFGAGGKAICICGPCVFDQPIRLWDMRADCLVAEFRGHHHGIDDLVFTGKDGQQLISSGDDGIRWWDLATGDQVRASLGPTAMLMGHYLARFSRQGNLSICRATDGVEMAALHQVRDFGCLTVTAAGDYLGSEALVERVRWAEGASPGERDPEKVRQFLTQAWQQAGR